MKALDELYHVQTLLVTFIDFRDCSAFSSMLCEKFITNLVHASVEEVMNEEFMKNIGGG